MGDAKSALGGAATGAAAGSVAGPWGAAIGGLAGGAIGLFSADGQDELRRAQEAKLEAGRKAAADYKAYRDVVSQARMQAMANTQGYFDVNSNMLNSMNGGQGTPDSPGAYQSPILAQGMKPYEIANSTPHAAGPMPTQNAPAPGPQFPGGKR